MKLIIKRILYFISKLYKTLEFFAFVLLRTDLRNHIPIIKDAQLLTVPANGPSLKDDLDKIDFTNGDFCVVNDFYKSPWYSIIKPKYHVLADPLYFRTKEDIQPFVDAVKWDMILFVPYKAWKRMKILNRMSNSYIQVIPYHSLRYFGFECFRNYVYNRGLSMPMLYNVLQPTIFNAIKMGYKEIRLYGVDHSWTEDIRVNDKNEVCLIDRHFYDEKNIKLLPWEKTNGEIWKMYEILSDLSKVFFSYCQVRKYADYKKCRIINCTENSYIDAFEREENV